MGMVRLWTIEFENWFPSAKGITFPGSLPSSDRRMNKANFVANDRLITLVVREIKWPQTLNKKGLW